MREQLYREGLSCLRLPYYGKRMFNLELPVKALGRTSPSLLHDMVDVGVDPPISP